MSMKLLVVDDDPAALDLVKALVEPQGFEVLAMADSRRAAECANKQGFDGIFVDVLMPKLDGFELTKLIRTSRLNSRAPIVMITASEDVETMRRGFKAGVTFFLTKPFHPQKLRGLLLALRSAILRERKRHVRLPLSTKVTCRWGYMQSDLRSVNIGEHGMLLESSSGLESGQEIKLEFTLPPAQKPLSLRAKVVHKEPPDRIDVQFHSLTSEDLETIRQYISRGLKEPVSGS
jgi:DNA-binding response OmpR family regulator